MSDPREKERGGNDTLLDVLDMPDELDGGASDPELHRDAKMWSFSLEEASERGKAQAEIWRTGLETLLPFAGLFAGVVAAFLIESRKKLRMDDQEFLLQSIENAIRGQPSPPRDHQPTLEHLWVNGLWFTSLIITLFSAIMGVLAKSWVDKYTPSLPSKESRADDFHRRWRIEQQATTWKLERMFTSIPLLIQFAFFLFAIGLSIQCLNDHPALGATIVGIVATGTAIYLFLTAAPLFIIDGTCPFQTPLSQLFIQLRNYGSRLKIVRAVLGEQASFIPKPNNNILVTLWGQILIQSPVPEHVDEAIAEVGRHNLTSNDLELLASSGTVEISLKRIKSLLIMTSGGYEDIRDEAISNHLLSLSCFVKHWAKTMSPVLKRNFESSLAPGNPFSSWDSFPDPVRPLAFTIRVPILLLLNQDVPEREATEKPWEQLVPNLQSRHRLRFVLANCCALVNGGYNLRRISKQCITSCMALAIKSNCRSEWSGVSLPDKLRTLNLARGWIARLCNEIIKSWKEQSEEYWTAYSSTRNVVELDHENQRSGFPQTLAAAFVHHKAKYRSQAVFTLLSLCTENYWVKDHRNTFATYQRSLIHIAVSDEDREVRAAATSALRTISMGVKGAQETLLHNLLAKPSTWATANGELVLNLVASLTDDGGLIDIWDEADERALVGLVDLMFGRNALIPHWLTGVLFEKDIGSLRQQRFEAAIGMLIKEHLTGGWASRVNAFKIVERLWSQLFTIRNPTLLQEQVFQKVIQSWLEPLAMCAMSDFDSDVRMAGRKTMTILLDKYPRMDSPDGVSKYLGQGIVRGLSAGEWEIRHDAIEFLRKNLAEAWAGDLVVAVLPYSLRLVLHDEDEDVQDTAVSLLEEMVAKEEYTALIAKTLFPDLEQYLRIQGDAQQRFIPLVAKVLVGKEQDTKQEGLDYLFHVAIHTEDCDIYDTALKALLYLSSVTRSRILDHAKGLLPPKLSLEWPEQEESDISSGPLSSTFHKGQRWVAVLLGLTQNESLRDACFSTLQACLDSFPIDISVTGQDNISDVDRHGQCQIPTSGPMCSVLYTIAKMQSCSTIVRTSALRTLHSMLGAQAHGISLAWKTFQGLSTELLNDSNADVRKTYIDLVISVPEGYDCGGIKNDIFRFMSRNATVFCENLEVWKVLGREEEFARYVAREVRKFDLGLLESKDWIQQVEYAELLGTLAKAGDFTECTSYLVAMSIREDSEDIVRRAALRQLKILASQSNKNNNFNFTLKVQLGKNLKRSHILKHVETERMTWVNILVALSAHATGVDWIYSQLIDLAVQDDDHSIRNAAYQGLHLACQNSPSIRELIATKFATALETVLFNDSSQAHRCLIFERLSQDCFKTPMLFDFQNILESLAGPLWKAVVNETSNRVQAAAEDFVRSWICHTEHRHPRPGIENSLQPIDNRYYAHTNNAISILLAEIEKSIPTLFDDHRALAVRLINAIPPETPDTVIDEFAQPVLRLLRDAHSPNRYTALEISEILYSKGLAKKPIQSHVLDILSLAVEDSPTQNHLQVKALQLLLLLCDDDTSLLEINAAWSQLTRLLEKPNLRLTLIDLISLLCRDTQVRRSVVHWMVSAIARDSEEEIEGIMALISELLVERRLSLNLQLDFDMICCFIPALITSPRTATVRSRITALLCCNYQDFTCGGFSEDSTIPELLIDAFIASVFGKYVAAHELKAWEALAADIQRSNTVDT